MRWQLATILIFTVIACANSYLRLFDILHIKEKDISNDIEFRANFMNDLSEEAAVPIVMQDKWLNMSGFYMSNDDTPGKVRALVDDVIHIFKAYVAKDEGVRAGLLHFNSCRFQRLLTHIRHHPRFAKLKILLAKNHILNLSFNDLVPMGAIMDLVNATGAKDQHFEGKGDFLNLMIAIEKRLAETGPSTIMAYNIYHSSISRCIRETATGGIISYLLKALLVVPVFNIIFHDFIRLNFHFHMLSPLFYAMLSVYNIRGVSKSLNIRAVASTLDAFLTNAASDVL